MVWLTIDGMAGRWLAVGWLVGTMILISDCRGTPPHDDTKLTTFSTMILISGWTFSTMILISGCRGAPPHDETKLTTFSSMILISDCRCAKGADPGSGAKTSILV